MSGKLLRAGNPIWPETAVVGDSTSSSELYREESP
jgi:hypothetical protein